MPNQSDKTKITWRYLVIKPEHVSLLAEERGFILFPPLPSLINQWANSLQELQGYELLLLASPITPFEHFSNVTVTYKKLC